MGMRSLLDTLSLETNGRDRQGDTHETVLKSVMNCADRRVRSSLLVLRTNEVPEHNCNLTVELCQESVG